MAHESKVYERLSRTRRKFGGYASLWLASDHLLQVQSTGYSESYQRFYLQDIKGLFVTESKRRLVVGIISFGLALLVALAIGLATKSFAIGVSLLAGLSGVFLLWNYLLGPGCKVFLATNVQTIQLDALVRRPYSSKIIAQLSPIIEAAQSAFLTPATPPRSSVQPPPVSP